MKLDTRKLASPARPRYFEGRLLGADDFRAEQSYVREKMWLHNRMLHGYGIVAGLDVTAQEQANGDEQVVIAPGYALDGYGRELIVREPLEVAVGHDRRDFIVLLKYLEQDDPSSAIPVPGAEPQAAQTRETVQVLFESPAERLTAPPARPDFAVPLARLRKPHHQWQHDRNFRPPRAK